MDESLKRWMAPTRHIDDGHLSADNNWIESQIRLAAVNARLVVRGQLACGSERCGDHEPDPVGNA